MPDLPDYYTMTTTPYVIAKGIQGGAEASLPADNKAEDFFLATDTERLWYAIVDAAWRAYFMSSRLLTAHTILYAAADYTPAALSVPASRIVGRKAAGNIVALTFAEVLALLSGQAGAAFSMNSQKIIDLAAPTLANDAVRKAYADGLIAAHEVLTTGVHGVGASTIASLADLASHAAQHQSGGADEISVAGLSGLLADDQHVLDAEVLAVAAALVHAAQHQNGGADEISIAGLDGESVELAAHKILTTGIHGVGASTIASVANIATHAAIKAANATLGHVIVENGSDIDVDAAGKLTLGGLAASKITSERFPMDRMPDGTDGYFLKARGAGANPGFYMIDGSHIGSGTVAIARMATSIKTATITFIIDGGGSAITTGQKGHLEIPFGCTINQVTMMADQSGSIVVDIWKDTYANFPPTDGDSITASAPPTITTAQKSQDSTLTGWTTAFTAGDILAFNVDSCTTIERVTISLKAFKT